MRISDWSSDVCSSDLLPRHLSLFCGGTAAPEAWLRPDRRRADALRRALRARHPGRQLVGITWRSISPSSGPQRSIDPALWRPVLSVPQCAFVGLQYGAMPEDYEEFRRATGVQPAGGDRKSVVEGKSVSVRV